MLITFVLSNYSQHILESSEYISVFEYQHFFQLVLYYYKAENQL